MHDLEQISTFPVFEFMHFVSLVVQWRVPYLKRRATAASNWMRARSGKNLMMAAARQWFQTSNLNLSRQMKMAEKAS